MDREEYIRAAREIRDNNSPGPVMGLRPSLFDALPVGGGRRILEAVAGLVRRTELQLRALEPPPADRADIERHFLRPWSELADYLEGLLVAPRTKWLSAKGALKMLEGGPRERREDMEFCVAYGLEDGPEPGSGSATGQPPAHSGNGKV